MTNCNFCGSQFQIEKAQDEEIATPDGILPFKVTKENKSVYIKDEKALEDYIFK